MDPAFPIEQAANQKQHGKDENSNFTPKYNIDDLTRNLILRRSVHRGIPPF